MDSARTAVRSLNGATDRRPAASAGSDARLELVFERRGDRTVLAHGYAEPPYRVGTTFVEGSGVHMILATVAPGIFGGDRLQQRITVGPGARVRLTSQSALQLHPSRDGRPASVQSTFEVRDDGELTCFWDPLIPFAHARLHQRIAIHLSGKGRLVWNDALMTGRAASGERWSFAELAHELAVSRDGSLEYLERYTLAPAESRTNRRWIAGNASHFGTALATGWPIDRDVASALHESLNAIDHVRAAADCLTSQFLLARLLATSGTTFRDARGAISKAMDRALIRCEQFPESGRIR